MLLLYIKMSEWCPYEEVAGEENRNHSALGGGGRCGQATGHTREGRALPL